MPWKPSDATRHTKNAKTKHEKKIWASAANAALKEYGDEGRAVRVGDAAVNKYKRKHSKKGDDYMNNSHKEGGTKKLNKKQRDAAIRDAINGLIGAVGLPGVALNTTRPILSM